MTKTTLFPLVLGLALSACDGGGGGRVDPVDRNDDAPADAKAASDKAFACGWVSDCSAKTGNTDLYSAYACIFSKRDLAQVNVDNLRQDLLDKATGQDIQVNPLYRGMYEALCREVQANVEANRPARAEGPVTCAHGCLIRDGGIKAADLP